MSHDERPYWVALSLAPGIGPVRFQRLLDLCGDARGAWHASDLELAAAGLERRSADVLRDLHRRTTPDAIVSQLARDGIGTLTLLDDAYPENLREIADPPPVLFVRGHLRADDAHAVAIVGTRRATAYGRAVTERLARELAQVGLTVVSGLAKGIDTVSHRAALDAGGRTVAVLGNGLDQVYPPENARLADQITGAGALVSEFAPGVPPDAVNFPRRNRIIAGLSRATVIVEAGERSGALITADFALEQGRDVLAVPGSIFSPLSHGPNELLKQGATPVTSAADVLNALDPTRAAVPTGTLARGVLDLAPQESSVWEALDGDPRHVDEVARAVGRAAGDVSATLALLELKGMARQVGAMLYTRA